MGWNTPHEGSNLHVLNGVTSPGRIETKYKRRGRLSAAKQCWCRNSMLSVDPLQHFLIKRASGVDTRNAGSRLEFHKDCRIILYLEMSQRGCE
jgi:hypothetical protein